MFEEGNTSRPRDLPGSEKYWGDSQWRIHRTMKDMGILYESDNPAIPAHIAAEPGKVAAETAALFSGNERQKPDFLFGEDTGVTVPKKSPVVQSSPLFGDADQADRATLWKRAAKAAGQGNTDTGEPTGGIGKLFDDYGRNHRVSQGGERKASGTAALYKAGGLAFGSGSVAKRNLSPDVSVATQPPVTRPENERYAESLRFLGPDPEDRMRIAKDLSEASPGLRATGYLLQAFGEGNLNVGANFSDPFIHAYNIYDGDFRPKEHLSFEENKQVEAHNHNAIKGLHEISSNIKLVTEDQISKDADLRVKGKNTLLGEVVDKGSVGARNATGAILDVRGGKAWQTFSKTSSAISKGLKAYYTKMLEYREWRDDQICDPTINPLFGSWCQKELRSGADKRTTAEIARKNLATVYAMRDAGVSIGVSQLKKWFTGVTGHAEEGALIQFCQRMGIRVTDDSVKNIWKVYGDDVSQKAEEMMEAINQAHEWYMNNN